MKRSTTFRQYEQESPDLDKIRAVSGNPDLTEEEVFSFPVFTICRSGRNYNNTDITGEGQTAAVTDWIGKAVFANGHEDKEPDDIAGRIYDAWIEEEDGQTVTKGKAFAPAAESPESRDDQKRIANRMLAEMSCEYDVVKSVCSLCGEDVTRQACKQHATDPAYYCRDMEFKPSGLVYCVDPAVPGAGTMSRQHAINPQDDQLRQDGETFRQWAAGEFRRWYRLGNPAASHDETESLASRLSAREMVRLARINEDRFKEVIPDGRQQTVAPKEEPEEPTDNGPQFKSIKDVFNSVRRP